MNNKKEETITPNKSMQRGAGATKMKVAENKPDIETVDTDVIIVPEEVRGNRENFFLRNNNIMNANRNINQNNPVRDAMNRNMFKKF